MTRVKRLVNPRRTKNASARRRMTPKQIRHFGTKRQKAALKAARTCKRAAAHRVANPPRPRRHRHAAPNPANLITLGLINPHTHKAPRKKRRTKTMAATKRQLAALRKARAARKRAANPHRKARRSNPHRTARHSRRNSTKVYVIRKNRRHARRSNPEMFGMSGASAGKAILAGLVGVYATKTVTPMVANVVPQVGSSNIVSALISGVVAWGGGFLIAKWDKTAGAGFMFGGLMQAGSQLLNSVISPNPLSLSGLGDFQPAIFAVPENPIRRAAMARAQMALPPATPTKNANLSGMAAAHSFM